MALPFELQALAWPESNRQQMETLVHSSKKEYVKKNADKGWGNNPVLSS